MKLLDVKEIVFEDGSKSAPLHSGLDGDILLGNFNSTKVAVKRFAIRNSTSISRFNKESTFLEIETLRNVLRPLGIVRQAPHYWIVFPYFPMGDLGKVSREDSRLSPALRILLCIDLCDALLSVHELGFVFRDLKTANILVDHNFHAKLTDFGSVQSVSKGLEVDTNEVGPSGGFHKRLMEGTTLLYAAPEVISLQSRHSLHLASDVYSLGITVCEVFMGEPPFHGILKDIPDMNTVMDATYNEQSLLSAICNGHLRPVLVTDLPALSSLVEKCWEGDMTKRMTCSQALQGLKEIATTAFNLPNIESIDRQLLCLKSSKHSSSQTKKQRSGDFLPETTVPPPPPVHQLHRLIRTDPLPLSIGSFATSGRRGADKMEDRHSVTHSMLADEVTVLSVILVLDGHGGQGCAEFVNTELSQRLHAGLHVEGSRTEEDCVIKQAFLDTDRRFLSLFPRDTSGSTALALMVWTRNESILRAVVANAGDCRLVVACKSESKYIAQRITKDHNCDQDSERERIINLGGNLVRDKRGNFRVDGFIKVTRAFGNSGTKRYVFPEPEISPVSLVMGVHDFLVVGSDGLFDNMTDQEVIQTVLDTAKQAGLSAKRLGSEAIARGVTDNVTALVIFLRKWNESGKSDWVAA